jgi:hypothetical protein
VEVIHHHLVALNYPYKPISANSIIQGLPQPRSKIRRGAAEDAVWWGWDRGWEGIRQKGAAEEEPWGPLDWARDYSNPGPWDRRRRP